MGAFLFGKKTACRLDESWQAVLVLVECFDVVG
jgi:hypothetical protein